MTVQTFSKEPSQHFKFTFKHFKPSYRGREEGLGGKQMMTFPNFRLPVDRGMLEEQIVSAFDLAAPFT